MLPFYWHMLPLVKYVCLQVDKYYLYPSLLLVSRWIVRIPRLWPNLSQHYVCQLCYYEYESMKNGGFYPFLPDKNNFCYLCCENQQNGDCLLRFLLPSRRGGKWMMTSRCFVGDYSLSNIYTIFQTKFSKCGVFDFNVFLSPKNYFFRSFTCVSPQGSIWRRISGSSWRLYWPNRWPFHLNRV